MTLTSTNFHFPGQTNFYRGKVRDVYTINNTILVMVASDRISAFDHVLPEPIPHKGQVLNQTAAYFLNECKDLVPNWVLAVPDPNVTAGIACKPFQVEMVIRGYLAGHAWRTYKNGGRTLSGVTLPDGLRENDRLPVPVITPSTKAVQGHDEDISRDELIAQGLIAEDDYALLEAYTRTLFEFGQKKAASQGLILVDTKYEFGKSNERIYLIDEIHTPDSSRYFYQESYERLQKNSLPQRQLSKEFVREWLMECGFQGKEGQQIPVMSFEKVTEISSRYIELYEILTGQQFKPRQEQDTSKAIEKNIFAFLENYS